MSAYVRTAVNAGASDRTRPKPGAAACAGEGALGGCARAVTDGGGEDEAGKVGDGGRMETGRQNGKWCGSNTERKGKHTCNESGGSALLVGASCPPNNAFKRLENTSSFA